MSIGPLWYCGQGGERYLPNSPEAQLVTVLAGNTALLYHGGVAQVRGASGTGARQDDMNWHDFEQLDAAVVRKLAACREMLRQFGGAVVAFSAGVDSTFLLALAAETLGSENVLAAMGVSPSLAERERRAGALLAAGLGVELVEVPTGELDDPRYAANPPDRCYHCKSELFTRLKALAEERKLSVVLSGANADDRGDFRPGLQAAKDLGVRSPLMEAGLRKDEIRAASRACGLETWDKPAMACLASRVPYGQAVTAEKLSRIEQAEYVLKDMGFGQCRVRDHGELARIEVPQEDIASVAAMRQGIVERFKSLGYTYVSLDLQGFRSGSMNETIVRHVQQGH